MIATATMAQGVIDVHSHIITPDFVSALESEGRQMDEGFPLPIYNVENHLKWMDETGVQTSVLTLAAPQVLTQSLKRMQQYLTEEPGVLCLFLQAPIRRMFVADGKEIVR